MRRYRRKSTKKRRRRRTRKRRGGLFCRASKAALRKAKQQLGKADEEEKILNKVIKDMEIEEVKMIEILKKYKDTDVGKNIIEDIKNTQGMEDIVELLKD
jgi:hypothetical protein